MPDENTTRRFPQPLLQPATAEPHSLAQPCLDLEFDTDTPDPSPDPLPPHVAELLSVAGVPHGLLAGQTVQWVNAAQTSPTYLRATASYSENGDSFELLLRRMSGDQQRLRCNRYGDILVMEDSRGIECDGPLHSAMAAMLLDFKAAVKQLMITH